MPHPPLRYEQAFDGAWMAVVRRAFRLQCCDCGLVHRFDFRLKDGAIELRAIRDGRATGGARAARKRQPKNRRKKP